MGLVEDLQAARDDAAQGRHRVFQAPRLPGWPAILFDVRSVGQAEFEDVTRANQGGGKGMARVLARLITNVLVDQDGDHISFGEWAYQAAGPDDQARLNEFRGDTTTLHDVAMILRLSEQAPGEPVAASDVVLYLVPADNDILLNVLFARVADWLTDTMDTAAEVVLGE